MRMKTQRILAAMLSLVLLLALAPAGWAVDLTTPNTVNVNLVPKDKEGTEYESDIVNANIVADLYLVASAVKDDKYDTYHYEFKNSPVVGSDLPAFDDALIDEEEPENQNKLETMLRKFTPLAHAFAETILTYDGVNEITPTVKDVEANGTMIKVEGLSAGLYMLILHGKDLVKDPTDEEKCYVTTMTKKGGEGEKDTTFTATRALSDDYEFIFEPQLITVPTKEITAEDGTKSQSYNTAYGEWTNTLNIVVKPDWKPRNGILKITKTLTNYADLSEEGRYFEPMLFTFSVVGRDKQGEGAKEVYRKVVALSVDSPVREREVATLEDIPIGTWVTVTEIYSGAHATGQTTHPEFQIQSPTVTGENGTTTITSQGVNFVNVNNDTHRGGHGIENKFTFSKDKGWGWVATGGDGATSGAAPESEVEE